MARAKATGGPFPRAKCELKLRAWIVIGRRVKLGDGRAALLQRIDELGSIKKAVAEAGMSYRNVWGYLGELERAAGVKLLARRAGGGAQSGTRLTPAGKALVGRYWRVRRALTVAGDRRFVREFSAAGR